MTEEQLVLERRKPKILCAKRQVETAGQSGIIIDTLRFTLPQRRLLEQERLADDFDAGDLKPAQIARASAQRAINWLQRTPAPVLVQINRAMGGDSHWLQGIGIDKHNRPVPRSLRRFSPISMYQGLRQSLDKFIPKHPHPPEPARAAA